jgi:glc operon protein GlcG
MNKTSSTQYRTPSI